MQLRATSSDERPNVDVIEDDCIPQSKRRKKLISEADSVGESSNAEVIAVNEVAIHSESMNDSQQMR